jgi:hypothetical protein
MHQPPSISPVKAGFLHRFWQCEHCGFYRATRSWCNRCSSIDPFPRRRRIFFGLMAALLLAVFYAGYAASEKTAQRRLAEEAAKTETFRVRP